MHRSGKAHYYTETALVHAKRLRAEMTDAEQKIWYRLRRRNLAGVRFRKQVPIGSYIADFASYQPMLIIEIDGGQHNIDKVRDKKRDAWLEKEGYSILRFWNHDVMNNMEGVLEVISANIDRLRDSERPLPNPPPQGGGNS